MDEFRKFLNHFRCEKGTSPTHTCMKGGKYIIPNEKSDDFVEAYTRAMVKGTLLHLTEKPMDPSPLRSDLDFRFALPATGIKRLYTRDDIVRIVTSYFKVITRYVDIESTDPNLWTAYVMEKPGPKEDRGKVKDGVHIVWPGLVMSNTLQQLIRKHMLDGASDLFSGMKLCNTFDQVIDQAIIDKNNWLMYGSRKPEQDPYVVTAIYNYDNANGVAIQMPLASAEEELRYVRLFMMRQKADEAIEIRASIRAEIEEYQRHVLPAMDERRKGKLQNQIFMKTVNQKRNYVSDDELTLARQIVAECLSVRRAENYEDWIKVGWALRNIDYRLLDSWIDFSRVSSKYIEGVCQMQWDKMRIDTLGMGTLRWWARVDNERRYNEIMDNNVITLIDRCSGSEGAHFDVAKVIHAMYKDRYRFTCKDTWYTFKEDRHRWVRTREGLTLRMVMSQDVCSKFMERVQHWNTEANRAPGGDTREICETKSKQLLSISLRLKTSGYKDSVMKECKCLFTDENFEELLDSHPHLIGFENGVYDLRMQEFRDGLPDDFISFCTRRYYMQYDATSPEVAEIQTYLSQVFTNVEVCRYMKDLLACVLDGGIRQEKFYVFTGSGCHAKGARVRMYDNTVKAIEEIQVGDCLIGDDSSPRRVERLWRGNSIMLKVTPTLTAGSAATVFEPLTVTPNHKLVVQATADVISKTSGMVSWFKIMQSTEEDGMEVAQLTRTFDTDEDADTFMHHLRSMPSVVQHGQILHIQAQEFLSLSAQCFRMRRRMNNTPSATTSHAFEVRFDTSDGGIAQPYYGVQVDGNHRYTMEDGLITANSNSKSMLLSLVQRALGDYYCILPIALLTQKRAASNSAQAELERTRGRRCAVMQEPGESEKLNVGLMKELSGGDIIQCRGLFKEPIEFKPQFKMIMTCNELPEVGSDDGGTWRRLRVIEFTSKFVENPDPKKKTEFPMDGELGDKFERWADTFLSMIIEHHRQMDPKLIAEPVEVRIATEAYKKNNDLIGQFISEHMVADETHMERLGLNKTYNEFKVWIFNIISKGKKVPERSQFRAYMEKIFGVYPSCGKGWRFVRYIPNVEGQNDAE